MAAFFNQNMLPCSPVTLVNMSMFCAKLRLEFHGKTIAARLVRSIMKMGHETTKTWYSCSLAALVNMSVFRANLQLEFCWKTIAARLVHSIIKNGT